MMMFILQMQAGYPFCADSLTRHSLGILWF